MILLICDHPKREIFYLKKLQQQLKNNNINCKIINKGLVVKAYNLYKPKIITIPHSLNNFFNPIDQLNKKVIFAMIPTESSIFNNKFIEFFFCNKFKKTILPSNHNKVDAFFTQSKFVSNLLEKKLIKKKKMIDSGFLYYDYWYQDKKFKKFKNQKKNIGIALTSVLPFRYYNRKDFIVNYFRMEKDINYFEKPWRFHELNLNLYYISLVFKIIDRLSKKYNVSLRPHPLDSQSGWEKLYKNNKNVFIDANSNTHDWVNEQDVIISTFSAINIDSYVFKKPHISLIDMIPKEFLKFSAYDIFPYTEYKEYYSYKPKTVFKLEKKLKKIKFKKSIKIDRMLKKYYNFPSKNKALDKISKGLIDLYKKSKRKNFKHIYYSKQQRLLNNIFGQKISSFLLFFMSESKIYFQRFNNHNYFSKFTKILMKIPYLVYSIIYK